jgi:hypothetical protein
MHPLNVGTQFHQLPMFMSAREIRSQYQALDGDRTSSGILGYVGTEDGYPTSRSSKPSKEKPYIHYELHTEDDDDLFDRKYEEAQTKKHLNGDYLSDHIAKHGVENPVSLRADPWETGSRGKPEILGGHHRIAVMETERPDELMPVEHYHSVAEARWAKGVHY